MSETDSDTKVFGVPLSVVMARPNEKTIPSFVKQIVRFLNTKAIRLEGIFRISSNSANLQVFQKRIDSGEDINFSNEEHDPHLIAGLLKCYLRDLPEPLFTFELYPKLIGAIVDLEKALAMEKAKGAMISGAKEESTARKKFTDTVASLLEQMPIENQALAELLLLFLNRIGKFNAENKMSPANLAIVFGRVLLRPKEETVETMMNASKVTEIMKFMIENFDNVFPKQLMKRRGLAQAGSAEAQAQKEKEAEIKEKAEMEKLKKIKETVDDAIGIVQKKLTNLSGQLQETESLDVAIDIARRVRTAKKVLFAPGLPNLPPPTTTSKRKKTDQKKKRKRKDVKVDFTLESGHQSLQGKRKNMEDEYAMIDDLHNDFDLPEGTFAYYAVYDGHGGSETSRVCGEKLHVNIIKQPAFSNGSIAEAICDGIRVTDEEIIKDGQQRGYKDGSTAVIVVINDNMVYAANCGDSEAIICSKDSNGDWSYTLLTEKHRATDPAEKQRIEKEGGAVFGGRVFGALAVSRSMGDRDFKKPTSEANFVTSEPYQTELQITDSHQFLIVACDGLWDKFTYQEAMDFVVERLDNPMSEVSAEIAQTAITKGSMDNVTAVVVKLVR